MVFEIPEIKEVKVVTVDVEGTFCYIDKLKDGSWRICHTKNLEIDIKERDEENI
jgi:hypothetical protein